MTKQLSQAQREAAAVLAARQRARESLVHYALSVDIPAAPSDDEPGFTADGVEIPRALQAVETSMAKHHEVLLEAMQRTMCKPRGRLMVFMPPGAAKSTYGSVVGPAWYLSKFPKSELILTSYSDDLPLKSSRRIRDIIRQTTAQAVWPERPDVKKGHSAVKQWGLTNGSGVLAAGILSGVTGNRADGLVIDDPVKNREEADSETHRRKVASEYKDSLKTRLKPKAWIILIMTRWHESDLSGEILPTDYDGRSGPVKCRDGEIWEVLNIPAECERLDDPLGRKPGEFLWPEWFPREHWEAFKNDPTGQRTWNALFQQRPTAGTGTKFLREDTRYYDPDAEPGTHGARPKLLKIYGASDFASKEDESADFTEHGVFGVDANNEIWVLDWWYGQKNSEKYLAAFITMVRRWKPLRWFDEGNVIGHTIAPIRLRMMREATPPVFVACEQITSIQSKPLKVAGFATRWATGMVHVPANTDWAERLITQLCAFPAGRYDDAVDTCGVVGRALDKMHAAQLESARQGPKILVPFTGEWLEYEEPRAPEKVYL